MEATLLKPQTSKPPSRDTNSSGKRELISEYVVRFALNADKAVTATEQAVYCATWEEAFSDVDAGQLEAAFIACLRSHTYKTIPTIGDIRRYLQKAHENAAEERAAQKWDRVLGYAARRSPDIPEKSPPRISEQTRRAISAAGGLDFIRDCNRESLTWARKRFIEAYIRYGEMQQEQFLLPEGEIKNLLGGVAQTKALLSEGYEQMRERGLKYANEMRASGANSRDIQRATREIGDWVRFRLPQST